MTDRKSAHPKIPKGFELLHTLQAHTAGINAAAWSGGGKYLATGGDDCNVFIWDYHSGTKIKSLELSAKVLALDWSPNNEIIVTATADGTLQLWDAITFELRQFKRIGQLAIFSLAWSHDSKTLATGSRNGSLTLWSVVAGTDPIELCRSGQTIRDLAWSPDDNILASLEEQNVLLWDVKQKKLIARLVGHTDVVNSLSWSSDGHMIASGSDDQTIRIWDAKQHQPLTTIEGHSDLVNKVCFSPNGKLLASKSEDGTVKLWDCSTYKHVAILPETTSRVNLSGLHFHPIHSVLATRGHKDKVIRLWQLDYQILYREGKAIDNYMRYKVAKVVLLGDSGVGKTSLGWRLLRNEYKAHSSTHGQQIWHLPNLLAPAEEEAQCDVILWDLAGQPDYRLLHALFLNDVALALILLDPTQRWEPLKTTKFWLEALRHCKNCRNVLVGAKTDLGDITLTAKEIRAFFKEQELVNTCYISTSAKTGQGIEELHKQIQSQIDWTAIPTTITTSIFHDIKSLVLTLKAELADCDEQAIARKTFITLAELDLQMAAQFPDWTIAQEETLSALKHLELHGYILNLETASGSQGILLQPELLTNAASSLVLEARRNKEGLGALDEAKIYRNEYVLSGIPVLASDVMKLIIESAVVLFIKNNICFREVLGGQSFLVFPELINREMPPRPLASETTEKVFYIVTGATQNLYASIVVLLGYTNNFSKARHWKHHATYETENGNVFGFKLHSESHGQAEFSLFFDAAVSMSQQNMFQGLFETLLLRQVTNVKRLLPLYCDNCDYTQERAAVLRRLKESKTTMFCSECGEQMPLQSIEQHISKENQERHVVDQYESKAKQRTHFEACLAQVKTILDHKSKKLTPPSCFISYAWGNEADETWVEQLALDLSHVGIKIIFDKWENAAIGSSIPRFVSLIDSADMVIVVGTSEYLQKYHNKDTADGYVVAAEMDLINNRLLGTEESKKTVYSALLRGDERDSLPPLLHKRTYADFRPKSHYFSALFDLVLTIYKVSFSDPKIIKLRSSFKSGTQDIIKPTPANTVNEPVKKQLDTDNATDNSQVTAAVKPDETIVKSTLKQSNIQKKRQSRSVILDHNIVRAKLADKNIHTEDQFHDSFVIFFNIESGESSIPKKAWNGHKIDRSQALNLAYFVSVNHYTELMTFNATMWWEELISKSNCQDDVFEVEYSDEDEQWR